jgi:heat shock protein HslJ
MIKFPHALTALALAVFLSACASTEDSTSQMVAVNDTLDPDEVRCKTVVKTGTRIGTKVCKTNRAWKQAEIDARDATKDIQRTSLQGPAGEGN